MPKNSGFSLIELLIYISILSILTMVTSDIFISLNKGRGQSEAQSEVNSNLRFAVEKISQDIKSATAVNTPAAAGDSSTSLVLAVAGDTVTYDVSNGQLRRQVNAGSPEQITAATVEIDTADDPLVFTKLVNINSVFTPPKTTASVQIEMKIKYKSASPDWQFSEKKQTTISLR